ncbi:MAG: helix-hairpin-helix domain-containing protein [Nitrospira sp.]|nr:helix-hairpin-helix domain-containing protein [Nitrospira sp.]MDH4243539.1 helix-hairpin-helix domain-containing protein [Nitrospira sp.]MDH4355578.1 helix-hairpin-helix domain-containing protein [Nitrospira sp.]MDH5318070.1 helix-hairpin-helix domain-containing protein [Nitrospira sp.]
MPARKKGDVSVNVEFRSCLPPDSFSATCASSGSSGEDGSHSPKKERAMVKSFLFKVGLLVVAMGVSFWAIADDRPKAPIAAVMDEPLAERPPRLPDSSQQTPKIHEVVSGTRGIQQDQHLVDLNQASAEELEALPGIGAVLAQRVIALRTSTGGFRAVEDLREVKGIGAKKFNRIKSLVMVSISGPQGTKQREL